MPQLRINGTDIEDEMTKSSSMIKVNPLSLNGTDFGELTCGNFTSDYNITSAGSDAGGNFSALNLSNLLNLNKWIGPSRGENNDDDDMIRNGIGSKIGTNPTANIYSATTQSHCPYSWDGVLCWPPTIVGNTANLPCMEKLHGIPYNTSGKDLESI